MKLCQEHARLHCLTNLDTGMYLLSASVCRPGLSIHPLTPTLFQNVVSVWTALMPTNGGRSPAYVGPVTRRGGRSCESHAAASSPAHQNWPNLRVPPFESETVWGPNQAECTPQHHVNVPAPIGELGGRWQQTLLLLALDQRTESILRPTARVVYPFTRQHHGEILAEESSTVPRIELLLRKELAR